jgi:hypothetical protein
MPRCRRESHPARAHLVEVTDPAAAAHRSGLVETKGLTSDVAQRKIDRLAFRAEVVAIHDAPAELVVDVDVRARHLFQTSLDEVGDPNRHPAKAIEAALATTD